MGGRAIVTVLGRDRVGIVAKVAAALAEHNANIEDISQTLMGDIFSMVMQVSIEEQKSAFKNLQERLNEVGAELGVQITIQQEDIFKFMHRI